MIEVFVDFGVFELVTIIEPEMTWNQVREHVTSLSGIDPELLELHHHDDEVDHDAKCDLNPKDRIVLKWELPEPHHPIHYAAEIVKCWLDNGVDVNLRGAVSMGNTEIVEELLRCGADVNAKSDYGYTVLHYAVGRGSEKIYDRLVAAGANPIIPNDGEIS